MCSERSRRLSMTSMFTTVYVHKAFGVARAKDEQMSRLRLPICSALAVDNHKLRFRNVERPTSRTQRGRSDAA